jgi:hypothetical protein
LLQAVQATFRELENPCANIDRGRLPRPAVEFFWNNAQMPQPGHQVNAIAPSAQGNPLVPPLGVVVQHEHMQAASVSAHHHHHQFPDHDHQRQWIRQIFKYACDVLSGVAVPHLAKKLA